MNVAEKQWLSREARMQMDALRKIGRWKILAIALSSIGIVLTYNGMTGEIRNLILGICGVILILTGIGCAILLGLGERNGKRNVEKILDLLDKGDYEV